MSNLRIKLGGGGREECRPRSDGTGQVWESYPHLPQQACP